jgi:probable DNA repair protein
LEVKARQPRSQPAGAWARAFHDALQALGWPGERPLDSAEHQAREKWQELLETLATLERVLPPLAWGDALARLGALAADTAFQPQSPPAPVQVLGLLESGGLSFARLWVLGLDDEAWPPPARPNPFLPLALQRRLDLPNASAAQALDFARRHTQRLRQAAPVAVFSHALSRGDTPLRASPLVADLPLAAPGSLPLSSLARPAERVQAAGGLRPGEDNAAPPLTGTASGAPASGGTGIFKDMAACPFRAFAKHRLRAEALEQPVPGLGPDRRGQLAHRALEFLWRALGGHAALLALTPEQARTLADETAAAAIGDCERRWRRDLSPALAALERQRLAALLLETLEVERGRAPFRVAAREEEREATLGGVTVRMRIDRMDELPGGGLLLLDYKTGAADVRSWFGPRPDEPQLPLYALAAGERVSGLAFFAVKRGNTGFRGLAESPDAFPGAKEFAGYEAKDAPAFAGRAEVFASWRGALEDLGRRFAAGDARVDPKDPRQTCRYCELGALCRITAPLTDGEQGTEPDSAGDGHDAA